MGITFSSECRASFEAETESSDPRQRARRIGRPRKNTADEDLKSSVRSKPVTFEDFEDLEDED